MLGRYSNYFAEWSVLRVYENHAAIVLRSTIVHARGAAHGSCLHFEVLHALGTHEAVH